MVDFKNILGTEKIVNLASSPEAAPATVGSSGFIGDRVQLEELEIAWKFDPIVFNSINKNVQAIMAAGYEWRAKSPEVKNFFIKFFDNIGNVGSDTTFEELLEITFQNEMIYGKHFTELIYNKKETHMVDLLPLDPKVLDYARDTSKKVILDRYMRPIGFIQKVASDVTIPPNKGDPIPGNIQIDSGGSVNVIFLKPERIAHFKLYTYGNLLESIGLIEPAYRSIVRRQKIEEAQSNSIYARGTYPIIDYVGDLEHSPTPDMIKKSTEKLAQMSHKRYFSVPYWHNIKPLEVKQSEIVDNTMRYLRENSSAALGVPLALATGSGEATNRSTLVSQLKFMEHSLIDIVNRTLSVWKKQVFKRISKLEGFDEIPELVWGDINAEAKDEKAKRLIGYANNKVGILSPDDVRNYAIRSEGLDAYIEGFGAEKIPPRPAPQKPIPKEKDNLSKKKVNLKK